MASMSAFARANINKPSDIVAEVLAKSGLLEELQKSVDPQDQSRVENLSQLQSTAAEYEQNTPDATLGGFLETTALVADSDQLPNGNEDSGKVTMMTLHTAKGLEYPVVFLTGLEQGTFPHSRSLEDTAELSEERRLAYVGITRAKRRLYITRAAVRAQWGQANEMLPSQFLEEIPDELIDWKRRETGSERMRTGWGDGDEFGGWDDEDDFSSGPTFGTASYGSYGSSHGSAYGSVPRGVGVPRHIAPMVRVRAPRTVPDVPPEHMVRRLVTGRIRPVRAAVGSARDMSRRRAAAQVCRSRRCRRTMG